MESRRRKRRRNSKRWRGWKKIEDKIEEEEIVEDGDK